MPEISSKEIPTEKDVSAVHGGDGRFIDRNIDPDIIFDDSDPDGSTSIETLTKTVGENMSHLTKLYTDLKKKYETLSDGSDAQGELKKQLDGIEKMFLDNVAFSDIKEDTPADKLPHWYLSLKKDNEAFRTKLDDIERFNTKFAKKDAKTYLAGFSDDKKALEKFSFLNYIFGMSRMLKGESAELAWKGREHERDVAVEMARREGLIKEYTAEEMETLAANDQATANPAISRIGATRSSLTTSQRGGVLFPDGVMDMLIDPLLEGSLPEKLGFTMIRDLGRNKSLSVPMFDGGAWIGKGGEIPSGTSKFTSRKLTPKKFAGMTAVTSEALNSITPGIEMTWRNYLMDLFRIKAMSRPVFEGTGTGAGTDSHGEGQTAQPNGLIADTGIPSGNKLTPGTNGGAWSFDYIRQMIRQLAVVEAVTMPSVKFACRESLIEDIFWQVLQQFDGQDRSEGPGFLFRDMLAGGGREMTIRGIPIVGSNSISNTRTQGTSTSNTSHIGGGPWNYYYCATWRNMEVLFNRYSDDAYTHDLVQMRVILETDLVNVRPNEFVVVTGLTGVA